MEELVATLQAAVSIDNLWPASQLLVKWRHTAEIYADPLLSTAATRVLGNDGGPPPAPGSAGERGVSPKRGDQTAPPPKADDYDIRFADNQVTKGWEQLCAQAMGNACRA